MADTPPKGAGVKGALTKKYGPLPGYGWLAVAGVGAFAYLRAKGKSSGSSTSATDPAASDAEAVQPQDYGPYQSGGGYSQQGGSGAGSGAPGVDGDQGGPPKQGETPPKQGETSPPTGKGNTAKHHPPHTRKKKKKKKVVPYKTGLGFASPYKAKKVKHK